MNNNKPKNLLLTAKDLSLRGMVGEILPPTSLKVTLSGLTIITGGSQMAKNALGLALTGRMAGYKGQIQLNNNLSVKELRLSSALIDAPGLSEPDEWMTLSRFISGELKLARQAHNQEAINSFLGKIDALDYRNIKIEHLPINIRYKTVLTLVKMRQNKVQEQLIHTFCIISPGRHDTRLDDWWLPTLDLLEARYKHTVILICQESIYDSLNERYSKFLQDLGVAKFKIGSPILAQAEAWS